MWLWEDPFGGLKQGAYSLCLGGGYKKVLEICDLTIRRGGCRDTKRAPTALHVAVTGTHNVKGVAMWITSHGCKEWHVYLCKLTPSTADFFLFIASCNIGHFIFKSPRCTTTKGSNYPIPVISLHPTQKARIARKLRKPRFNQYHMLFYLFTVTFLPEQGLWIPRAVNSKVFMFQLCWAVSWPVVRTNIIITNLVLWAGQRGEGTRHSHFLSSPKLFP